MPPARTEWARSHELADEAPHRAVPARSYLAEIDTCMGGAAHGPEEPADRGRLFVWPSRNSINGLEYGNGAVKLYNRAAALAVPDDVEDFSIAVCTTRIKFRQVVAETRIHASAFQAWTSGFREGFKLRRRIQEGEGNALRQFEVWTTRGAEVPNGRYAIAGAHCGSRQFDQDPGFAINDRARLRALFRTWRKRIDMAPRGAGRHYG